MASTQPGNGGCIGLFVDMPEITPQIATTGRFRRGPEGESHIPGNGVVFVFFFLGGGQVRLYPVVSFSSPSFLPIAPSLCAAAPRPRPPNALPGASRVSPALSRALPGLLVGLIPHSLTQPNPAYPIYAPLSSSRTHDSRVWRFWSCVFGSEVSCQRPGQRIGLNSLN